MKRIYEPSCCRADDGSCVRSNDESENGQILSMAGKKIVNKDGGMQIEDYALGTMTSSYELGSTVKGATLLTGYQTEAIKPYTHFFDAPMYFKGSSKPKKSWKEFGDIDDLRALQVSSNVYMFNTALKWQALIMSQTIHWTLNKKHLIKCATILDNLA